MGLKTFSSNVKLDIIISDIAWVSRNILYVDPVNGNNSGGKTWAKAFTTFAAAYDAATTVTNQATEIRMAFGTYDLNTAGAFSLQKNLIITGGFAKVVNFTNSHISATGVFSIDASVGVFIADCTITGHSGASFLFGVKFNFLGRLDNVRIDMSATTVATSAILIAPATSACVFNDVWIHGNFATTIGFDGQGDGAHVIYNMKITGCAVGIKLSGGSSRRSSYDTLRLNLCTVGIDIAAGCDSNKFFDVLFFSCATEVIENAAGTIFIEDVKIDEIAGVNYAVTSVLYVSPGGEGIDGKTWRRAFTRLQDALDAASTDPDLTTLILLAPVEGTVRYDINTTGDPTWTGNYIIQSAGRHIASVKNDHVGATSVLKFTGKVLLSRFSVDMGTANNGITLTSRACEVRDVAFMGQNLTSAAVGLLLEGTGTLRRTIIADCLFLGNAGASYFTGLKLANTSENNIRGCTFSKGLIGVHLTHADDDDNHILSCIFNGCATAIQIDLSTIVGTFIDTPLFTQCDVNITDNGTDTDIHTALAIDEIAGVDRGVTSALYVSPDGENVDGKTWRRAFNTIAQAVAAATADLNSMTLIILASATYDLNIAGALLVDKNIMFYSSSEFSAEIQNTHASATGIFKVTEETIFDNLSMTVDNNITAIEFSGANTGGCKLNNVVIGAVSSTAAHTLIRFTNAAHGTIFNNVKLIGNASYTTALDLEGSNVNNIFEKMVIYFCLLGIHIRTGGYLNEFTNLFLNSCANAVTIDSGASVTIFKDINMANCTVDITDNGAGTTVIREVDVDSMVGMMGYKSILYVSPSGDDSDGKSWASAINSLWDAIALASSGVDAMTEIMVAAGTYDIDQAGDPTVSKNLHIRGVGGNYSVGVSLVNNHASATSVLKFTGIAGLFNLAVDCGTSNNGVIFSGSGAVNGKLVKVDIVMSALTSAKTGVLYENCAFHLNERLYLIGNPTYATGIKFDNVQYYIDWEDLFLDCLIGISCVNNADDYIYFNKPNFNGCVVGVNISGNSNDFILDSPRFTETATANLTAIAAADYHILNEILDREVIEMYPTTAGGGVTATGAAADVYGVWATVVAASVITKPFKIIGLGLDAASDLNAYYFIQIAWGPSDTIIATLGFAGAGKSVVVPPFNSGIIPENSQIRCRIQTSNGGGDTVNVWVNYKLR